MSDFLGNQHRQKMDAELQITSPHKNFKNWKDVDETKLALAIEIPYFLLTNGMGKSLAKPILQPLSLTNFTYNVWWVAQIIFNNTETKPAPNETKRAGKLAYFVLDRLVVRHRPSILIWPLEQPNLTSQDCKLPHSRFTINCPGSPTKPATVFRSGHVFFCSFMAAMGNQSHSHCTQDTRQEKRPKLCHYCSLWWWNK